MRAGLLVCPVLLFGCARASQTGSSCGAVSPAIVAAAGMPVYNGCEVDVLVGEPNPPPLTFWRPDQVGRIGCFRVVVELVVDPDGHAIPRTEHVVVNSETNFLKVVLGVIPRLEFSPAIKGTTRVAQLARLDRRVRIERWIRTSTSSEPVFADYVGC